VWVAIDILILVRLKQCRNPGHCVHIVPKWTGWLSLDSSIITWTKYWKCKQIAFVVFTLNVLIFLKRVYMFIFHWRAETSDHLPTGWPFETTHYSSTFTPKQYSRYAIQPASVHRKNNPHPMVFDPWKHPSMVGIFWDSGIYVLKSVCFELSWTGRFSVNV
jgi:hypothetical protein